MSTKTIKVFEYFVFSDSLSNIKINNNKCRVINTISPNSYGIATKNKDFEEALKNSDYLVLDGVYFALASILLQGKNIKMNQGPDVFYHFMDRLNALGGKAFFLGASDETLSKIKKQAQIKHTNVKIDVFSPPYKQKFSKEENLQMINAINTFHPDILFVGMTAPKQEIWAYQNKNRIKAKLIICIGGVFDWYAGNQKEIHPIWWKLRLAWLKRTIDRPEILKRYPNIGIFFWQLFLALIGIKKYKDNDE